MKKKNFKNVLFAIWGISSFACTHVDTRLGGKESLQTEETYEQRVYFSTEKNCFEFELKGQGNYLVLDPLMDMLGVRTDNGPAGSISVHHKNQSLDSSPIRIWNNKAYCQVRIDNEYLPKLGANEYFDICYAGSSTGISVKRKTYEFRFLDDLDFLRKNGDGKLSVGILQQKNEIRYTEIAVLRYLETIDDSDKYLAKSNETGDFFTIQVKQKRSGITDMSRKRIFSSLLLTYGLKQIIDDREVILDPFHISIEPNLISNLENIETIYQSKENRLNFSLKMEKESSQEVALFIPHLINSIKNYFVVKGVLSGKENISFLKEMITKYTMPEINNSSRLIKEKNREMDNSVFEFPYYYEFICANESLLVFPLKKDNDIWSFNKPFWIKRDDQKSFIDIYDSLSCDRFDHEKHKSSNLSVKAFSVGTDRKFKIEKYLGNGYGGSVYKIRDTETETNYAMKVTKSNRVFKEEDFNNFGTYDAQIKENNNEIKIREQLKKIVPQELFVQLLYNKWFKIAHLSCIIMELAEMTFKRYLEIVEEKLDRYYRVSANSKYTLMEDLVRTGKELEIMKQDIILFYSYCDYEDTKKDNLMVSRNKSGEYRIKVIDFGRTSIGSTIKSKINDIFLNPIDNLLKEISKGANECIKKG